MQKTGGIMALVAGIFGTLAGLVTLLVGGVASAVHAEAAATVVGLAWGGVLFSFATIALGAVTMDAKGRLTPMLLIICAIFGAILGGTPVAVCMILALVGGIVAMAGAKGHQPHLRFRESG
jgi:ABC-type amino acid transport system permease subunit